MIDKNFKGSIFEKIGYDAELCPKCNAHMKNGICLNACHLTKKQMQRFQSIINKIADDKKERENE